MISLDPLFLNFINKNEINVVKIREGVKEIPKGSFKEMYNLEYIEIPSSMEIIYENEFSDCININYVKCEPKFLKYFNMENLTSIYIKYGEIDVKSDPFKNCINLKNIIIPDFYKTYEDYLFRNSRQLVLKYLSGQEKDFRTRSS